MLYYNITQRQSYRGLGILRPFTFEWLSRHTCCLNHTLSKGCRRPEGGYACPPCSPIARCGRTHLWKSRTKRICDSNVPSRQRDGAVPMVPSVPWPSPAPWPQGHPHPALAPMSLEPATAALRSPASYRGHPRRPSRPRGHRWPSTGLTAPARLPSSRARMPPAPLRRILRAKRSRPPTRKRFGTRA